MTEEDGAPQGRLRAAWTLVLLTTLCAELTFTAVAVPTAWLLLPLLLVMYGAADWGWRALGVNWTYWESQIGVHVVFSVLVPVMLTNLIFPAHRGRPYLRTGGLVGVGVLAVVGVLGLRTLISATEHPGYQIPWGWTAGFVLGIAVLAWLALRVVLRLDVPGPAPASSAPRPAVVGVVIGIVTVVFLGLLLPPGLGPDLVFGDGIPLPVPLAVAALMALGSAWAVLRWSAAADWSDRHRVWLAGGT